MASFLGGSQFFYPRAFASEGRQCLAPSPLFASARGFSVARPGLAGHHPVDHFSSFSGGHFSCFLTSSNSVPFLHSEVAYKKRFWCHHWADTSNCSSEVEPGSVAPGLSEMARKPSLTSRSASLPCKPPPKILCPAGDRDPFFVFCLF